ncbi:adenylate/guanylate cyclase domain-containing protein [Inquilinus limosus]|uniref:adenylate/guanylate cyclase domain-containing protein n=1 Tax=Inquilinus limosus TaxID=171674 RepID=UPI003F13561C
MERRLAAVMIADVVGYSRHSQADEEGTRARFQADLHEVFEPQIARHHGRLVKTMGDALLVEFHSVVDAVRCAVEMQRNKKERNAAVPERERLVYRIGVNLGDVIVEGDDIHGDGVNIADRLQGLADPGGIAVAGTAYDHVKAKLSIGFGFLGDQRVKNIVEPVRVYRVLMDPKHAGRTIDTAGWSARRRLLAAAAVALACAAVLGVAVWQPWRPGPETAAAASSVLPLSDRPSIAVLPFANMSGDAEQGYLADGLTEDMTTDLARVPGLLVISRNAAFQYKDRNVAPAQVAAELRVRYILAGSVRRVGDELRINAQLIDATTGLHKWAERFEGAWTDVFSLQDDVIRSVVNSLELRLAPAKGTEHAAGGTDSPAAYDAFLQGLELIRRDTPADLAKAVPHLEKAILLDPNYGEAHAALAQIYKRAGTSSEWERAVGASSYADTRARMVAHLQEAMKHPSPRAFRIKADLLLNVEQHDEAIADLEHAIALNPSDYETYVWMAYAMNLAGRPTDAQRSIDAALRLDPRASAWLGADIGFTQFCAGRFEEAAATLEKRVAAHPEDDWSAALLAAAYGHLGRDAGSLRVKLDALAAKTGHPAWTLLLANVRFPFKERVDAERLGSGLRKVGVPELPFGYDPMSKDRLSDDEIESALFGHTLHGYDVDSGASWILTFASDGSFMFLSDSRAASASSESGRIVSIHDRVMCWGYPTTGSRGCGTLFRVPEDAVGRSNDLLWIAHVDRIHFSVVE